MTELKLAGIKAFERAATVPTLSGSCASCRHGFKDGPDLVCRRMPPQVSILMVPAPPPRAGGFMPQALTSFPIIRPEMWCGEFRGMGE